MVHRIVVLAIVASLTTSGALAAQDPAAVRRTIEAKNAAAMRWYRDRQVDSLVTLFAADIWQFPPNMPPVHTRDSLRAFWTMSLQWGQWEFQLTTQDVVTNGPIAVERGRYTLKFTPEASSPVPAMNDRGNYLVLWRRETDGQWRVVWDAPVSELPPQGSAPGPQ